MPKRTYSQAQLAVVQRAAKYPRQYQVAKRRRMAAVATRQAVGMPLITVGRARTSGFYGRFRGPNAELKFLDTALSWTFDNTMEIPATGGQIALVAQGDTESTRDGRQATIKSVQIRGNMRFVPGATTPASGTAHMWLVLDKQTNGAAAAVTDIFTSNTAHTALINLENSQRFSILDKWVWDFNPTSNQSATVPNNQTKHIDFYRQINVPMIWSSTTGAITEIRSNNIFLVAGSVNADDLIEFNGVCRIRFRG